MLKRTISWIATVMLLLGLTCGAAPSAFAADTEGNAQIGWITDFTDLTKWSSAKLDGTLASDLSSSDSTVNVAKGSVSETGFGATLFAGYSYTENGELFEQYGNDYYLAYQKVTIDLDAYPYLYTKYTPGATDSAFQLGVSLYDPVWTGIQTGEKTKNLCQGDGVEIDGKYRRVNLKSALGVEGEPDLLCVHGYLLCKRRPMGDGLCVPGLKRHPPVGRRGCGLCQAAESRYLFGTG